MPSQTKEKKRNLSTPIRKSEGSSKNGPTLKRPSEGNKAERLSELMAKMQSGQETGSSYSASVHEEDTIASGNVVVPEKSKPLEEKKREEDLPNKNPRPLNTTLLAKREQEEKETTHSASGIAAVSIPAAEKLMSIPDVAEEGEKIETVAHGVKLKGKTHASFSNNYKTKDLRTDPVLDENGKKTNQIHFTGTLLSTFKVATQVSLPSVWSFKGLTKCQRQRVQDAITNELAPHEQEHVAALKGYEGTVETPFDLTMTRKEFAKVMRQMHNDIEQGRRAEAQAASDALDPFEIDVDIDCVEPNEPKWGKPRAAQGHILFMSRTC
jgi:hypothetical protein